VAAAQVLHERVSCRDGLRGADRLQSAHRPQPCFEPAVISFDDVVGVLLEDMPRTRGVLCDDPWVDRCPVGGDLDRSRTMGERAGEQRPRRSGIAAFGDQHIDDLAVLVDRPVQVGPASGDLDVSLVDEPTITRAMASRLGGVDNSEVKVCTQR
jgi:hypothetical protein